MVSHQAGGGKLRWFRSRICLGLCTSQANVLPWEVTLNARAVREVVASRARKNREKNVLDYWDYNCFFLGSPRSLYTCTTLNSMINYLNDLKYF